MSASLVGSGDVYKRQHEAPEQPVVQREFQKRWAYPKRCRDASELRVPVSYTHLTLPTICSV
eukprot:11395990-Alexandrium_andersonii.AAC.1